MSLMSSSLSVLYVDDEPFLLDIGKIYLERSGICHVTVAESGSRALELMQREKFDAVISDYQMPEMDGLELLTVVRRDYGNIPFIIFTGRGREEVFINAVKDGVDFYVQKGGDPGVQFAELIHKVIHAVAGRRAENFIENEDESYSILLEELKEPAFITGKSPNSTVIANKLFISLLGLKGREENDLRLPDIGINDYEHRLMLLASLQSGEDNYVDSRVVKSDNSALKLRFRVRRIAFRGDMALFVKAEEFPGEKKIPEPGSEPDDGDLLQIIENANSIIIKWTPGGIFTYFNSFAEKFFGYKKSEVLGKNLVGTIVSERDHSGKDLSSLIAQIARDPGSFTNNENENITKDGRTVLISWTNSGIFDRNGDLCGIVSVGNEITGKFRRE